MPIDTPRSIVINDTGVAVSHRLLPIPIALRAKHGEPEITSSSHTGNTLPKFQQGKRSWLANVIE